MVTKLISILIFQFCIILSGYSQSKIEQIKIINEDYFSKDNQIIQLNYSSKTRYVSRLLEQKKILYIGSIDRKFYDLAFIDSFSRFYYLVDKETLKFKHKDSLNYESKKFNIPFDLINWSVPSELFFLNFIPIKYNISFFSKQYSIGKVVYSSINKDTIVVKQRQKKTKIHRKLYLDKYYHIWKIEYEDYNKDNLQEKWSIKLIIFNNENIYNVGESLKFGPYRKTTPKVPIIEQQNSLQYIENKLLLPLIDGSNLKIDTAQINYYVIYFWYLACKPCHLLRPALEKINTNINTNKVVILGYNKVDIKNDVIYYNRLKKYEIPEIEKSNFNIIQKDINKINTHPTIIIFDKNFKIVKTIVGFSSFNIKELKSFFLENSLLL